MLELLLQSQRFGGALEPFDFEDILCLVLKRDVFPEASARLWLAQLILSCKNF